MSRPIAHIFGMPSRINRAQWEPTTRALWQHLVSTAREDRSTELDIDEWEAAVRADQAREQDQADRQRTTIVSPTFPNR